MRVFPIVAEADGNRTRQRLNQPLTGFEDRGTHQASGRLPDEDTRLGRPDRLSLPFDSGTKRPTDSISHSMPERSFGRTVRYRRTKLGLSQSRLGELVGRSASTVRSWERDKSRPNDIKVLVALSAILGVDEQSLFEKAGLSQPQVETSPTIEQELATLSPDPFEPKKAGVDDEVDPAEEPHSVPDPVAPTPSYPAPNDSYAFTAVGPAVQEPSYIEDRGQRQLYRVRNLATIVILVALGIAFLWALTEGLGAFGTWWDDFFGNLRL